MSQEFSDRRPYSDSRPDEPVLVEWGGDAPSRRGRVARVIAGIGRDHRLVPVIAGGGLVAVFAALVGDWTITTIPYDGPDGNVTARVPGAITQVGVFGTGYLVGTLALVGCLALMLFGSPAVRPDARVFGLATAGGLLTLLAATTATLDDTGERMIILAPDATFHVEYGSGLVLAFVGTAALGLALHLGGRFVRPPAGPGRTTTGPVDAQTGQDEPVDEGERTAPSGGWSWRPPQPAGGWSWRRPRRLPDDPVEADHAGPMNLTVAPTTPFARPDQQRDGR
jgi:hypothetical protein